MPELTAVGTGTGTTRPSTQCARATVLVATRAPVLVLVFPQWPPELRLLLTLSLTPLVPGRRFQITPTELEPLSSLAYKYGPAPASPSITTHSHIHDNVVDSCSPAGQAFGRRP